MADLILPGFDAFEGVDLVQKLPLFRTLAFDEVRRLFAIARTETRPAGDVIIDENALGQALYVVKSGRCRVTRDGKDVGRMSVGELFGEMSLVDDLLTSARVEAEDAVELLVLPRKPFEDLLASDNALAVKVYKAFCRTLSDRLRRTNDLLSPKETLANGVR